VRVLVEGGGEIGAASVEGIGLQAPLLEGVEELPVGREARTRDRAGAVAEELERAAGGDLEIELAERAGGGVPRIGEDRLALLGALAFKR